MDDLLARWSALQPNPSQASQVAGADLVHRYREPHRRYHDIRHLTQVLHAVDELAASALDLAVGQALDLDAVRLAAWFHDAVYDVTAPAGATEAASADLATSVLASLGHPGAGVREVARLVLLSATHDPAAHDANGQVLCDADLRVLAASPGRYAQYAADVRAEYAHVPEADFAAARAEVLSALLAHGSVYSTPTARARWEKRARANLGGELRRLRAAPR